LDEEILSSGSTGGTQAQTKKTERVDELERKLVQVFFLELKEAKDMNI